MSLEGRGRPGRGRDARRGSGHRDRRGEPPDPLQRSAAGSRALIDWMNLYDAFWRDRFDQLELLLNRMDQ